MSETLKPRGGTTRGAPVRRSGEPSEQWRRLQEAGLSQQERDRRAILAMAGTYEVSFEFLEVVGFAPGYRLDRPYRSWATELITVLRDTPAEVSLQHTLVMSFRTESGQIRGPVVMKHWRQDWRYEDTDVHEYAGRSTWRRRTRPKREVRGQWSQAVYQVDDSPRYEALGRWVHHPTFSEWESETTWRPLPRREFSVRSDYHVLVGTNRHTITPLGWTHAQENLKLALGDDGEQTYIAREVGLNRYTRIVDLDVRKAETYWQRTDAYWSAVRATWRSIYERDLFALRESVDGKKLYEFHFAFADRLTKEEIPEHRAQEHARETIHRFLRSSTATKP